MVVAVEGVTAIHLARLRVITGDEQPAGRKLDADARPRAIPAPIRPATRGGEIPRSRPRQAVIRAVRQPDGGWGRAFSGHDLFFGRLARTAREGQPDRARVAVHHGAGIAQGVLPEIRNLLLGQPGLAPIRAAAQDEINVTHQTATAHAPLGEGEHGSFGGDDQRGDAVTLVALARDEERLRGQLGGGQAPREQQSEDRQTKSAKGDDVEIHGWPAVWRAQRIPSRFRCERFSYGELHQPFTGSSPSPHTSTRDCGRRRRCPRGRRGARTCSPRGSSRGRRLARASRAAASRRRFGRRCGARL